MTTLQLIDLLKACTELEIAALRSSLLTWNGDFGFTDEITIEGKSKKAVGGVISSLLKKGILIRDDEFAQFCYGDTWNSEAGGFAADTVRNFLKGLDAPCPPPVVEDAPVKELREGEILELCTKARAHMLVRKYRRSHTFFLHIGVILPVNESQFFPGSTCLRLSRKMAMKAVDDVLSPALEERGARIRVNVYDRFVFIGGNY
jgi:hypothetical protein